MKGKKIFLKKKKTKGKKKAQEEKVIRKIII